MQAAIVGIRSDAGGWTGLGKATGDAPAVPVILQDALEPGVATALARWLAGSNAKFVACFGQGAETFHDKVDEESLKLKEVGPIRIWEDTCDLTDFFGTLTIPVVVCWI